MKKNTFELTFISEIGRVKEIIARTLRFFENSFPYITPEDIFELKLVLSELLCNAVIHGNKGDGSKCIYLLVEIQEDEILASVTDEGMGFDYMKLMTDYDNANLYEESGRGIMLVSALTDSLEFNSNGRQILFRKRVSNHG